MDRFLRSHPVEDGRGCREFLAKSLGEIRIDPLSSSSSREIARARISRSDRLSKFRI